MKPATYKYVLAFWESGTNNYHEFEDVSYRDATETAKAWLQEHFPDSLARGEWSLDKMG